MTKLEKRLLIGAAVLATGVGAAILVGFPFALAAFLLTRSEEVARVPLSGAGSGSTTFNARTGDLLQLWTSLDVEYEDPVDLKAPYDVVFEQEGEATATAHCDAFDVSTKHWSSETTWSSRTEVRHARRYQGLMRCGLVAKRAGPAKLSVTLTIAPPFRTKDMSLVVKR